MIYFIKDIILSKVLFCLKRNIWWISNFCIAFIHLSVLVLFHAWTVEHYFNFFWRFSSGFLHENHHEEDTQNGCRSFSVEKNSNYFTSRILCCEYWNKIANGQTYQPVKYSCQRWSFILHDFSHVKPGDWPWTKFEKGNHHQRRNDNKSMRIYYVCVTNDKVHDPENGTSANKNCFSASFG